MLTILALLTALTAGPGTDPWQPVDPRVYWSVAPLERWASYWPSPAPVLKAKSLPSELQDRPVPKAKLLPVELRDVDSARAGRLSAADFLNSWEVDKIRALSSTLAADLIAAAATSQVISSRAGERVVLSALLCQAHSLLVSEDTHTTHTGRMRLLAQQDHAQFALDVLAIQPLTCDAYPVKRLVQCLDIVPVPECTTNDELAAQVRASEKLRN